MPSKPATGWTCHVRPLWLGSQRPLPVHTRGRGCFEGRKQKFLRGVLYMAYYLVFLVSWSVKWLAGQFIGWLIGGLIGFASTNQPEQRQNGFLLGWQTFWMPLESQIHPHFWTSWCHTALLKPQIYGTYMFSSNKPIPKREKKTPRKTLRLELAGRPDHHIFVALEGLHSLHLPEAESAMYRCGRLYTPFWTFYEKDPRYPDISWHFQRIVPSLGSNGEGAKGLASLDPSFSFSFAYLWSSSSMIVYHSLGPVGRKLLCEPGDLMDFCWIPFWKIAGGNNSQLLEQATTVLFTANPHSLVQQNC